MPTRMIHWIWLIVVSIPEVIQVAVAIGKEDKRRS